MSSYLGSASFGANDVLNHHLALQLTKCFRYKHATMGATFRQRSLWGPAHRPYAHVALFVSCAQHQLTILLVKCQQLGSRLVDYPECIQRLWDV